MGHVSEDVRRIGHECGKILILNIKNFALCVDCLKISGLVASCIQPTYQEYDLYPFLPIGSEEQRRLQAFSVIGCAVNQV